MSKMLDGKVAIVTGAGGGLGRTHALYLASKGASVVVNDLALEAAEKVADEIRAQGGRAMAIAASVTDEAAVGAMVAKVTDDWGRIDILINNAGILRDKSFAKMTIDDFRLVVDVHLMGAAICCKAVWETMRAQGYGRIVMTTSSSGLYGNFGQANYGAAKMALVGLMQTLAIEGEKMTAGVLSSESLAALDPALVSPGLLALVGPDAPTRTILNAGAGHFACANVTLTEGCYVGGGANAGESLLAKWQQVSDRTGEIIPDYGFVQAEREVESARVACA
jgi:NADP-dependent 3-hydroxy acid dehydrogenase YdfG